MMYDQIKPHISGEWPSLSEAGVAEAFEDPSVLDYRLLIAVYEYGDYEGEAYVLAEKGGALFEVEAGHCSCNELEGSWAPTSVTVPYLRQRVRSGAFDCSDQVGAFLEAIGEAP